MFFNIINEKEEISLRVLFITNCPAPYRVKFFNELSKYCDLTVAFELANAKNRDRDWKSQEEYQFRAIFMKSWFQKEEGAFCPEIRQYIKEFRNDMIIVGGYSTPTGMYSITYMKNHRIPFILNSDGGMIKNDSGIKVWVKRFFIGSASAWLSTGTMCTQYLLHYGAEKCKIYEYPFTSVRESDITGVSEKQKQLLRAQLGIKEEKMILFVGSFIHRKGVDILLDACWDMENTALVLVGGTDISSFVPEARENPKAQIYLEGFKSEDEVKQYYQAADIFVLPTREDIWGLVVNEAMAAGLPVITTDHCGAGRALIKNGVNGYVIPVECVPILNKKIAELFNTKGLLENMRKNNLNTMNKYTIENMVKKHIEVFKNIGK